MATNIKSNSIGGIFIQSGNGIPNHLAIIGTIFIDIDVPSGHLSNGNGTWVDLGSVSSGSTFDVFVTGGTYSAGTAVFTNNSGNTFSVSGFSTGSTNTFTQFTGGTVTGATQFTNGLTANTISATTYYNLPIDVFITGGTSNNSNKIYSFTNNTGSTFSVSGLTDVRVTGSTTSRNGNSTNITFTNNTGGTFTTSSLIDTFISGGTYSAGTAVFTNNSGNTFSVSGFSTGTTADEIRLLINDSSTGIISFSGLSFTPSATTYSIGEIKAWFIDSYTNPVNPSKYYVEFSATSGNTLVNITGQSVTYIAISSGGTITQQSTPFSATQQRTIIPLGVIVHSNRTFINAINNQPVVMMNPLNQLSDLIEVIGPLNVSGNVYSANGANLNLNKTTGEMFKQGSNFINDNKDPHTIVTSGQTGLTFRYRTQTGVESPNTTLIDPDNYDVAGVITAIPGNKFTIQHIALFQSNLTRIQYGQNLYTTIADALTAIDTETFIVEQNIFENALQRTLLVVKGGTTDLTDTTKAKFIDLGKFGSTVGVGGLSVTTLQQAYNNSTTPEIVTDITLGALSIRNGTGISNSNQLEILNSASTTTFYITSQGNLSGNSITANTFTVNQINGLTGTSATTINLALSDQFSYTLSANTTFTFSNNANGKSWMVAISTNPITSGYTGTFTATTANVKWQNNVTPIITSSINKTDVFAFAQINSTIYGSYVQNF